MQEIRCPKCGEVFQVDDSGYDQIAQQVRDREFEKELDRRKKDLDAKREQELEIIRLQEEKEHTASITQKDAEISEKDQKIAELQAKLDASETAKKLAAKMDKKQQTAAGLFFSMLLRAAVIILGLAIVAFGAFFVMQALKGNTAKDTPATTLDENALTDSQVDDLQITPSTEDETTEAAQEAETVSATDRKILVLNSTDIAGLAGRWCDTLNANGYANTNASDYTEALADTKIVAREDGVGKELVQYFANASYEVGTVTSNVTESTDCYDVVIVIGASDSNH